MRTQAGRRPRSVRVVVGAVALTAGLAGLAGPAASAATPGLRAGGARPAGPVAAPQVAARSSVIVRAVPGRIGAVRALVESLGGRVDRELPIVDGFSATLSPRAQDALLRDPRVVSVTADVAGHVMATDPSLGYDPSSDTGSLYAIAKMVGAVDAWKAGYTGKGIDVALVDTGVSPVRGLASGNVINGPDLSFDSQRADVRYLDAYGHGTHMASIIAGRDVAGTPASYNNPAAFNGIAPDARIVNIKVGASDGAADVSQVIAAIDWVAQHAHDYGLNIRVLNLSFGTDSTQSAVLDPLAYAAEVAWRKGVLVVVAGGNDGTKNVNLANPALDGVLFAVGAEDPMGTLDVRDDTVPAFSNRGTAQRHVDVVAPGTHVLGLRVPNSVVDQAYPTARVGTRFFRGSGTSQSTAVVSGAAALLFQRYPTLTPQQAKMILGYGATWMAGATTVNSGAGIVNVAKAVSLASSATARTMASLPTAAFGTGAGSLEAARGSGHVSLDGAVLSGERDIFGRTMNTTLLAATSLAGTAWSAAGDFNGAKWTGSNWASTGNWAAAPWTTTTWAGTSWTAGAWASRRWANGSWDAQTWSSRRWADATWESRRWAGAGWS